MFGQPNFSAGSFAQQPANSAFGGFNTGGFGQQQQQQQQPAGLAFNSGTQQQQQPASSAFGGFNTGGGFGQVQQQQQQQPAASAFGSFAQQQPANSGFGGLNTGGGFGQQQQQQQQPATVTFNTGSGGGGQQQPATSGFGGFNAGGFGQQQQQPAGLSFGSGSFGQQQPASSAFGGGLNTSGFGNLQQPAALTFGGGGGAQQPANTGFGFNTGGFGSSQQQQQPVTSSFNFAPQAAATSIGGGLNFNTGGFGATTTSQAPSQLPTTQPQPFSFAQPKPFASAAPFSFSGASTLGQPQPSLFSQTFQQQPTQFAAQPLQFQQQQQQQQPLQFQPPSVPPQIDESHAFYQSIFQCHKFGDERDAILGNLNYVQAGWGSGKGHYSQTFPPVIYTPANPFYRFKAVSYAFIQTENNEDGHVTFEVRKGFDKVREEETALITSLQNMIGRPNIFFKITGMKKLEDGVTTVNLFAEDRSTLRRIPATDLAMALLLPHLKPHLDNLCVDNVLAKIRPSPEQLRRYLEDAPNGIDPRVWRQAQEDNPDPANMIPRTIIGIDALKKRSDFQQSESQQHLLRLAIIEEDVTNLQNRHTSMISELQQLKRKQAELSHRLLSVIVKQEIARKDGSRIEVEEEGLNATLCELDDKINSPSEFKGRLNELLSQVRLKQTTGTGIKYTIDEGTLYQIKEFLTIQQESIKTLVCTVRDDADLLQLTAESVFDINRKRQ